MGESWDSKWAINGCVRRSTFVFFLYSSRDVLKILFKLDSAEEEFEGVGIFLDIASAVRRGSGSECIVLAVPVRNG